MTSKHQPAPADSTGLSSLSQFTPRISPQSALLASVIPLPENPSISYALWSPATSHKLPESLSLIEQACRRIHERNVSASLLDSLLSSLHVSEGAIGLYVFAIGSAEKQSASQLALAQLTFPGLAGSAVSVFTPAGLYPCSTACSNLSTPCSACLSLRSLQSSSSRFPRVSLRQPLAQFLQSVREHLICSAADTLHGVRDLFSGTPAVRMRSGLLFGTTVSKGEWKSGWDHFSHEHPLTYCELSVHLSQTTSTCAKLVIQPWIRVSHYHALPPVLPLAAGTPLVLLPDGAPGYFLSVYTGPTFNLTTQFSAALVGQGVGDWKNGHPRQPSSAGADPTYVVVWVPVQGKSEDDKGLVLVWPAPLCVGFLPGSPSKHAQSRLDNLPTLPAHLQASPPPKEPHVPLPLLFKDPPPEQDIGLSLSPRDSPMPVPPTPTTQPVSKRLPHPGLARSPTSHTLQAFRSLTLQQTPPNIGTVTSNVSDYVAAVARERERERERLKRERQISGGTLAPVGQELSATQLASPHAVPPEDAPNMTTSPAPIAAEATIPTVYPARRSGSLFSDEGSNPDVSMEIETEEVVIPESMDPKAEPVEERVPHVSPSQLSDSTRVDAIPGFDSGWSQHSGDFLPTSNDYGMDFKFNLDGGLSSVDDLGMDETFGVFTEDDFDFFNGPALTAASNAIAALVPSVEDAFLTSTLPTSATDTLTLNTHIRTTLEDGLPSSRGPASAGSHPSPWTALNVGETSTPQAEHGFMISEVDATMKSRPSISENRLSAGQVLDQLLPAPEISSNNAASHLRAFDPLPFNVASTVTDGKYIIGKFALPSPPSEDDDSDYVHNRAAHDSHKAPVPLTWKSSYSVATDPRIGMTRRLSGIKRKLAFQGGRMPNVSPGRFQDPDDWIQDEIPLTDDNSDSDNEECWIAEDPLSPVPKPATPPPNNIPLGPTLLATHFHHPFLQQYAIPLNSSGATSHNTTTTPAALSAPTPISPAAILGTSSEKTKSLEAASQILLREAVENPVWADAWKASGSARIPKQTPRDIWPLDVKRAADMMHCADAPCPISLSLLLESTSSSMFQYLECPSFTISKAGEVTNILPSALRFWEKLGLSPRNGTKDVVGYVVFDQTNGRDEEDAVNLLNRLSEVYTAKQYGKHTAGKAPGTQDGVVPARFESFRKTLSAFVSGLPPVSSSIVIYIVTPDHILHLTSPILRQVLSAIKRINKTRQSSTPILFHFVPERLLTLASKLSSSACTSLELFVDSVYDRILSPLMRHVSCRFPSTEDALAYLQYPTFVLARPSHIEIKFSREESTDVLDVANRHCMLHVGYQVIQQGKWLLAACTDQWGEAHDLKAWLIPDEDVDSFVVNSVWSFAMAFASKASMEWHVIVSKRGPIHGQEMDAWHSHCGAVLRNETTSPLEVSLLSVDQCNPWYLIAEQSEAEAFSVTANRGTRITASIALDMSSTSIALHLNKPMAISLRTNADTTVEQLSMNDHSSAEDDSGMLPIATSTLIHIPSQTDYTSTSMLHLHFLYLSRSTHSTSTLTIEDIQRKVTKSFYELKILAQARWSPAGSHNLPLHLAALETMFMTLDDPDGYQPVD